MQWSLKNMGCGQSKEPKPMVDKDVDVKKRLQFGLHIAKDEAGVQFAFGKTCRKKYGPTVVDTQTPTESQAVTLTQESVETEVEKYKNARVLCGLWHFFIRVERVFFFES